MVKQKSDFKTFQGTFILPLSKRKKNFSKDDVFSSTDDKILDLDRSASMNGVPLPFFFFAGIGISKYSFRATRDRLASKRSRCVSRKSENNGQSIPSYLLPPFSIGVARVTIDVQSRPPFDYRRHSRPIMSPLTSPTSTTTNQHSRVDLESHFSALNRKRRGSHD